MLIICKSRNFIFQKIIQTGAKTFTSKVGKLSPYEVNQVLTANEYTREFDGGPVKSFDTNQLGSVGFFYLVKLFYFSQPHKVHNLYIKSIFGNVKYKN